MSGNTIKRTPNLKAKKPKQNVPEPVPEPSSPFRRQGIDEEYMDLQSQVRELAESMTPEEQKLIKAWTAKFLGTSPKVRNEYIRYLLHQMHKTGGVDLPFTEMPPAFYVELEPLPMALYGPDPDAPAISTAFRGDRKSKKKLSQRELALMFGTDRVAVGEVIRKFQKNPALAVPEFVALVAPFTKDKGEILSRTMREELDDFRFRVQTFYRKQTDKISDIMVRRQAEVRDDYEGVADELNAEKLHLETKIRSRAPNIDLKEILRNCQTSAESRYKVTKLKEEIAEQTGRNVELSTMIDEMKAIVQRKDVKYEFDESVQFGRLGNSLSYVSGLYESGGLPDDSF